MSSVLRIFLLGPLATAQNSETTIVSMMIHFHVSPKKNLNPGKILLVAIGIPLLLLVVLGLINYIRKRQQK